MTSARTIRGRKAHARGLKAENLAETFYREKGFDVLSKRYKTKFGEVDLILKQAALIVFLEVKARTDVEEGLLSVSYKMQQRLVDAAIQWIAENTSLIGLEYECRFDVAVVLPDDSIEIVENAFQAVA